MHLVTSIVRGTFVKLLILFFALIIPSQSQGASTSSQLFLNLLETVLAVRSGEVDSGTIKLNSPDASLEFLDYAN